MSILKIQKTRRGYVVKQRVAPFCWEPTELTWLEPHQNRIIAVAHPTIGDAEHAMTRTTPRKKKTSVLSWLLRAIIRRTGGRPMRQVTRYLGDFGVYEDLYGARWVANSAWDKHRQPFD